MTRSAVGLAGPVPLSWPLAPSDIRLARNAIHLWCASLNDFHGVLSRFSVGRFGKPCIAGLDGGRCLHFNTSHSDALAVYAVTGACPVGIDVERLREIPGLPLHESQSP